MTTPSLRQLFVSLLRTIALTTAIAALVLSFTGDAEAKKRPSATTSAILTCQGGGGSYSFDVFGGADPGTGSIGITCHGGVFDGLYCETSDFTHETACSTGGKPS